MAIDTAIAMAEADIWAALRLDLIVDGEELVPVDRTFIRSLIVAAEARLARFVGQPLEEFDPFPPALAQAITIDVATNYFDRLNPVLPPAWDDAIAGHRAWGFGG